ncbi:neoverrucotoxin subunit beta-like isoform X2 [Perca fluviatilis]|nr:neoverrucotoxin subunit beta-like isoform X2 [Perca fluviatilis]
MDTVDVMVETYKLQGALKVTKKVLEKLNRNDLVQNLPDVSSGPEESVDVSDVGKTSENRGTPSSQSKVEEIQQLLRELNLLALDPLRVQRRDLMKYSCELTLDTNTAHKNLKLSDNNRTVTLVLEEQPYPDHPERFICAQLLCRDGLTGRCYWEVERRGDVHISVSYRGISRGGGSENCEFGCNDQSWRLWCSDGGYSVWHNRRVTSISSSSVSDRVAVYVDCPAGSLSFYTVSSDSLIHIYTFKTTFTQRLYPGFGIQFPGSSVSLCSL